MHEKIVEVLVQSGANPELEDNTGRSVFFSSPTLPVPVDLSIDVFCLQPLDLIETLKQNTPATTVTYARRSIMESLAQTLERFVFEEVPPCSIKQSRVTEDNVKEYLVEWLDGK